MKWKLFSIMMLFDILVGVPLAIKAGASFYGVISVVIIFMVICIIGCHFIR